MDCIDHGVTENQTQLSDLHFHFHKEQEGGASDPHVPPADSKSWVCLNPSVPTLPHLSAKIGQVIISFFSFLNSFYFWLCSVLVVALGLISRCGLEAQLLYGTWDLIFLTRD